MSTRSIKVCDFPVRGNICGKEATVPVQVKLGNKNGANDVCEQHEKDVIKAFETIGLPFTSARTKDSKNRKVAKTKSGKTYTTADARGWLIENGHLEEGSAGRISRDNLAIYEAAN